MKAERHSWLVSPKSKAGLGDDAAGQAKLHTEAEKLIGVLAGKNPRRADSVRSLVRGRLARRHPR